MGATNRVSPQKLQNQEHLDAASAKSVVIKGFDGSSYPALSVDGDGKLNVNANIDMATEGIATEATLLGVTPISLNSVTRNADNFATQVVYTTNGQTVTVNITRDEFNNITSSIMEVS